jgi:hypothetical protein
MLIVAADAVIDIQPGENAVIRRIDRPTKRRLALCEIIGAFLVRVRVRDRDLIELAHLSKLDGCSIADIPE